MKIRIRLVLLLACLLVVFGASVALLQTAHRKEARTILASLQQERSDLLDRLLTLTGQSLHSFARDYSQWDDMAEFVQSGDRAWATINIDASLANFHAQAAWVIRPDGGVLYTAAQNPEIAPLPPPPADPMFLDRLRRERSLAFFLESPAGLLEWRAEPVLPSNDIRREQAARGWFIVARLWDKKFLGILADTLQSRVTLGPAASGEEKASLIRLQRVLTDWRGQPVQTLLVEYQSQPLAELFQGNRQEALLLYAFGAVIISVIVFGLSHWVVRPLQMLAKSLETGRSDSLTGLLRSADEFGHLARQVAQSFGQRDALRDSEEHQRQSLDLRGRLARDLHDGIIQSIYAAGLSLENVRNLRASDPAAADQRLATCQQMLNDTLWRVRNFIEALEPVEESTQTIAQALATLAANMRSLQSIGIVAVTDQPLAQRIGRQQETHLLQMAREAVSNALRHSGATQVRISLHPTGDNQAVLEIADNGVGFDSALRTGTGRGLVNLASRTREIGGTLHIDTAPGKGARIAIQFSPMP
jgi:signal transduction histidine kinase